jgi:hypothetical protein
MDAEKSLLHDVLCASRISRECMGQTNHSGVLAPVEDDKWIDITVSRAHALIQCLVHTYSNDRACDLVAGTVVIPGLVFEPEYSVEKVSRDRGR